MSFSILTFQKKTLIQGSWGLVREATESISHILFLFIHTEMKRKENEETFQITFQSGRKSV